MEGIVMCADSQESAGDYKFPVEKLLIEHDGWTDVIIAGSGLGPLVDMAAQAIAKAVKGGWDDYEIIQSKIEKALIELYDGPFRIYPSSDEDRIIDLLIAIRLKDHGSSRLFRATATAVVRINTYSIIGIGRTVEYEIQNLYSRIHMHIERCALIAMYLLNVSKSILNSVGGRGEIAILNDKTGVKRAGGWEIMAVERILPVFSLHVGDLLLKFLDPEEPEELFALDIEHFVSEITRAKKDHQKHSSDWKRAMDALKQVQPKSEPETLED
jgi:hypothetical protein